MNLKVPSFRRRVFGAVLDFYVIYPFITGSIFSFTIGNIDRKSPLAYVGIGVLICWLLGVCFMAYKGKSPSKYLLNLVVVDANTAQPISGWKTIVREPLRMVAAYFWIMLSVPVLIVAVLWASRHRISDPSTRPLSERPITNHLIKLQEQRDQQIAGQHLVGVIGFLSTHPKLFFFHDSLLGTTEGQIDSEYRPITQDQEKAA